MTDRSPRPTARRRFTREAQAASALNHPNIVTVFDAGNCEAGPFLAKEHRQTHECGDDDRHAGDEGREDEQSQKREKQIEAPLEHPRIIARRAATCRTSTRMSMRNAASVRHNLRLTTLLGFGLFRPVDHNMAHRGFGLRQLQTNRLSRRH